MCKFIILKFCFFQDRGSEPSSPNTASESALEAAVKARREKDKGGMFKAEIKFRYFFVLDFVEKCYLR